MSPSQPESPKSAAKPSTGSERSDRLATALRDNLKRRKAQARARRDTGAPASANPPKG